MATKDDRKRGTQTRLPPDLLEEARSLRMPGQSVPGVIEEALRVGLPAIRLNRVLGSTQTKEGEK